MRKINLAITGCLGRMGRQLIKSSKSNKDFKLVTLTENIPNNKKIAGIKINLNTDQAFKNTDVIVDFTVPKCTLEILKIASRLKKRVVIGTTGFTQSQEIIIKKYSKKIPILKAGNMSLGVNLLMYLTEIASRLKKRVVIGTTGFTKKEDSLIKKYSKKIPILKAGNMSLGVNLLM